MIDAKARLELGHLCGHSGRIGRVALEHLHGDGAALGRADQAEDDLRIVTLAVARMTARGQLAAASGQPSRSQVVQHQCGAHQVLARQAPFDGGLRLVQPVQRPVQVLGAALAHPEHAAQRRAGRVVVQLAVRGELGGGLDHAGHQHGQQQRLQLLGRRAEPLRGATAARAAKHGSHVPMRQAAFDGEQLCGAGHGHAPTQQHLQALDDLGGQAREVGQGALANLAVLAPGLAQEDRRGRVAIGHRLDIHGHDDRSMPCQIQ